MPSVRPWLYGFICGVLLVIVSVVGMFHVVSRRLQHRFTMGSLDFTAKVIALLSFFSFRPAENKVVKVTPLSSASDVCMTCLHVLMM